MKYLLNILLLCAFAQIRLSAQEPAKHEASWGLPPASANGPRITLPHTVYAVPGIASSVYFSNTVLNAPDKPPFFLSASCDIGEKAEGRWNANGAGLQPGTYPLTLTAKDAGGKVLEEKQTLVQVVPADAGKEANIALLLVGDSLTFASHYPAELARLFALPGNPKFEMLGSQRHRTLSNVAFEGFGGWSWNAFNNHFKPGTPLPGKPTQSPFLFSNETPPKPAMDLARYFKEQCGGRVPDFVVFLLGINDCFGLNVANPAALDEGISRMFKEADSLLAEFHKAAPKAELGLCLTTPPNDSDAAFFANYKTKYPRWNWRQVQHRIVERQIQHFENREQERLFVVPTELNLDTAKGYPENNAVHPNVEGYNQIGASIYCWLKARLAARPALKTTSQSQ